MTTPIDSASSLRSIMSDIDLGPTDSIQFAFAKLQLAQAQLCKNSAEQYLEQIEKIQKEQSEVAEMISRARALQSEAEAKDGGTTMPADMVKYFEAHSLAENKNGNDHLHNKDEWTENIKSLTNYQESISNKTQTLMVYLQDYISQYNSYLQGASSSVNQAAATLTAVATGR